MTFRGALKRLMEAAEAHIDDIDQVIKRDKFLTEDDVQDLQEARENMGQALYTVGQVFYEFPDDEESRYAVISCIGDQDDWGVDIVRAKDMDEAHRKVKQVRGEFADIQVVPVDGLLDLVESISEPARKIDSIWEETKKSNGASGA